VAQAAAAGRGSGQQPHFVAKGLEAPKQPQRLSYSAPDEGGEAEVRGAAPEQVADEFAGVGRNDACPCGSGKKFKKCHGAPGGPTSV
jgi:preprotein translocase subunit SecA